MKNAKKILIIFLAIALIAVSVCLLNNHFTRSHRLNSLLARSDSLNFNYLNHISSNADWFVYKLDEFAVSITSLNFPYREYNFQLLPLNGPDWDTYFFLWSPDSKALLIPITYGLGCYSDSFYIIQEEKGKLVLRNEDIIGENIGSEHCYNYQWNSDSSGFISSIKQVNEHNFKEIVIDFFDSEGKEINSVVYEYYYQSEKARLISYSTNNSIFILENDEENDISKLTLIHDSGQVPFKEIAEFDKNFSSIFAKSDNSEILLFETVNYEPVKYYLYDINTKSVIKEGKLFEEELQFVTFTKPTISSDKNLIGYEIRGKKINSESDNESSCQLIVWNWNSEEFNIFGEIYSLLGWDSDKNGFWVLDEEVEINEYNIRFLDIKEN